MKELGWLLLVCCFAINCFGQNFAYVIEDVPGKDERILNLKVHGEKFYFINTALGNTLLYSFDNQGNLNWRNDFENRIAKGFTFDNDTIIFFPFEFYDDFDNTKNSYKLSAENGGLLFEEPYFLSQRGNEFYLTNSDNIFISASEKYSGSGTAWYNSYLISVYSDDQELLYEHSIADIAIVLRIDDVIYNKDGSIYYIDNGGYYDKNHIRKINIEESLVETIATVESSDEISSSNHLAILNNKLVSFFNIGLNSPYPTHSQFSYHDFDGQSSFDVEFHLPIGNIVEMIASSSNEIILLNSDNMSKYSDSGELIWEHDFEFKYNGESANVALTGVKELSNGKFVLHGRLDESIIIFCTDENGCFSEDQCNVVEIGNCEACDLLSPNFAPQNLEVRCDNNDDYLVDIDQWLNDGGMLGYTTSFNDLTIDYSWSETYEQGIYEVTFVYNVPSQNITETYTAELTIEKNLDKPVIVMEPEQLIVDEGDTNLEEVIQDWLDLHGNMEVKHNCGTIEWIYEYDYDYSPGNHWVKFTATSDTGYYVNKSGLLSIVTCPGQLISSPEELILTCDQEENYKSEINQWLNDNGGLDYQSDCDSIIYSNDWSWNGGYTVGNYFITFTANGASTELEYSKLVFMSIQSGDDPPYITKEASDYVILADDPIIEDKIKGWLTFMGGTLAKDSCGEITWSNDFGFDYSPGIQAVTFTAKSENGQFSSSTANLIINEVSSANSENTSNAVSISPNPVNNKLYISGISDLSDYTIYSENGGNVLSGSLSTGALIDVSNLNSGVYYLKLKNNLGEERVNRFVKI